MSLHASEKKKFRLAFITKDSNINFFKQIERGCKERAKELKNVECVFAKMRAGNPHLQERALRDVVKNGIDGIAFAVINSDFSRKSIQSYVPKDIPVITIDADFSDEVLKLNPNLRKAYLGTDNYLLGKMLAKMVLEDNPPNKNFCILTGHRYSANLNLRISGFMDEINKSKKGYHLHERCPLYSLEDPGKAIGHLTRALKLKNNNKAPMTMVITGAWPQQDVREYVENIDQLKKEIKVDDVYVYSIDTIGPQMELLKSKYSNGNVGQRPVEMGRKGIDLLLKIIKGESIKEINYTGYTFCTQDNHDSCLK
jgi:ribose transport system substrate-binding protein